MKDLSLTLTKAAGICKPAFEEKRLEGKLPLEQDSMRHSTNVDFLNHEP
jgi:hypothetical protein